MGWPVLFADAFEQTVAGRNNENLVGETTPKQSSHLLQQQLELACSQMRRNEVATACLRKLDAGVPSAGDVLEWGYAPMDGL